MDTLDSSLDDGKEHFIEIWLGHIKASVSSLFLDHFPMSRASVQSQARSSRSSLQSSLSTSSLASAVRNGAKAIKSKTKGLKKRVGAAIARPLKRAKHALSNVSSPVNSGAEDEEASVGDRGSVNTNRSIPDVIEVGSDGEEVNDLEKELGIFIVLSSHCLSYDFLSLAAAQRTWRSPIYSFFKAEVKIEHVDGRVSHFFTCSSKKCKTSAGGVRRYQDKADKSSTANLRHHAIRCFGEDVVNAAVNGESAQCNGNIFNTFARQGQKPVTYSFRSHTNPEVR
jgi:hypothetical protein